MSIIEHYRDQDLNKLRKDVILAYKILSENFSDVEPLFKNFHPEWEGYYNDTWILIKLLERFGYHSYSYDTVLYTSEFQQFDKLDKITGDGLTFNQAVCNMFIRCVPDLQ